MANLKKIVDGEDEQEAVEVDQKLSESQKCALYKELERYGSLWDTSYVPLKNKQQKDKGLQELSPKINSTYRQGI